LPKKSTYFAELLITKFRMVHIVALKLGSLL